MKKIILTVISATLLLATVAQETKTDAQVAKSETGTQFEVKKSKRETMLEAELAKKEAARNDQAALREEKLQKLDADLEVKAQERSTRVY